MLMCSSSETEIIHGNQKDQKKWKRKKKKEK